MSHRIICADCGAETNPSDSDRGARRNFRWCPDCQTTRRAGLYYLFTCCGCCGAEFETWSQSKYCDPCEAADCAHSLTPWCSQYEDVDIDPDNCDDHEWAYPGIPEGEEFCLKCGTTRYREELIV